MTVFDKTNRINHRQNSALKQKKGKKKMNRQSKRPIALLLAFAMIITSFFGGMPAVKAYAEEKQWAQLKSGENNRNAHFTDDASAKPEAFVLSEQDFTDEEISFKMKLASETFSRFRFVNKYVDASNWSFIAYDGSDNGTWMYQYKYAGTELWPTLEGLPKVAPYDEVEVSISYNDTGMSVTVDNKTSGEKATVPYAHESIVGLKSVSGNIGFGGGSYVSGDRAEYTNVYFTDVKVGETELNNFTNDFKFYRENVEGQIFTTVNESATMQPVTPPSTEEPDVPGGDPEPEPEPSEPAGEGRLWRKLVGGSNNGQNHNYGTGDVGPITVLDMDRTTTESGSLSLIIKPNSNFAIFYNYVDNDNWLYVGYDQSSKWYYQYKLNGSEEYKSIGGSLALPVKGQETPIKISLDRETLTVVVGDDTARITNDNFIKFSNSNANRGKVGITSKTTGEAEALYFADLVYNDVNCMEDNWQYAKDRTGQIHQKIYTPVASVSGQVVDKETGTGLGDAIVRIGLNYTRSDANGNFNLEKIEVGTHNITVIRGGYQYFAEEITLTEEGISGKVFALDAKEAINLADYDKIQSENMIVYVGRDFPVVARYEMKGMEAFFRGNETSMNTLQINGVTVTPQVTVAGGELGSSKSYVLDIKEDTANLDLTMTVVISVEENTLTWQVTDLQKRGNCAKIASINLPELNLLSVDVTEVDSVFAGAQASTDTTYKADFYITFEEGFRAFRSDGYLYGFLSNGKLSAGLFSNSEVEGDKRVIRSNTADSMGLSSAVWYYEMGDKNGQANAGKYPDYPVSELPIAKVAIGADENKDSTIDWNDGALAFRKIMNIPYGSENVKEQVNSRIVMNFASMAPNPFLATADNIKKVYLATDGLPQAVMLKGYGNEGHDSANSEYPDIGERIGGVKDFQQLIKIAHEYNTEIGIHVNAQEIYPEAKSMNQAMVGQNVGNGWGWLDQSHTIDKLWDLSTQARWKRFVQLYDRINNTDHYTLDWPEAVVDSRGEVVTSKEDLKKEAESLPDNMDFIYLDVWYQDSWETRRIAEEINSLGWRFSTEFSAQGEYDSTWQHWSTDATYGGKVSKGFNSDIIRFIRNDQRDSQVLNYPTFRGTADNPLLGGYRLYGFEGWQSDKDFNNYILQTFNQNLPTKFLQHYYVTKWINYGPDEVSPVGNTEKEIRLQNDEGDKVVVTRKQNQRQDENIERIITLNDKVVLDEVKYLLPWTDAETKEVKLYHWNLDGGESTWDLTSGFETLDTVIVYELSDQGRINEQEITVTEGKVTLNAKPATAYVVVEGKGVKNLKKDFGEGDYVVDPGFNGYTAGSSLDPADWKGAINSASVKVEKSLTGDQRLAFNSPFNTTAVHTQIRNLEVGKHYVAEVYVQNDSDAKAYIGVSTDSAYEENYTEKSIANNYVQCDNKNGTKMQRMQVSFVATAETATLTLMREAGAGNTYMDDIRIVEKQLTNIQEDGSFKQDFETVVQGLYPFVLSYAQGVSDPATHLSQRNGIFTQTGWNGRVIDDVIEGEWSLKHHDANYGVIYQTIPQNFRFEPGKVYTVEFDYQSGPDRAYAMVVGDGVNYNLPAEEQYLEQARGTTKKHTMTVTASGTGQTWIGIFQDKNKISASDREAKMGQRDFVLDNLVIRENKEAVNVTLDKTTIYLGETAKIHGSNLENITWESSDATIAAVDTKELVVRGLRKGTATITATLPEEKTVTFTVTVVDIKSEDIPKTEYSDVTVSANTAEESIDPASKAVDGLANTHWHSKYTGFTVGENNPAILTVDFGKAIDFGGFKLLQRASGPNGIVGKYSYQVLAEDKTTVLAEGNKILSDSEKTNGAWVISEFGKNVKGRYLVISVTAGSSNFAAIAEIVPMEISYLGRVTIAGELSKTYDGTSINTGDITVTKSEEYKDSQVSFVYLDADGDSTRFEEAPKKAGRYYVQAKTVSGNETVYSNKLPFEIKRASLEITDINVVVDETKQGKASISVSDATISGVIAGETLVKDVDYSLSTAIKTKAGKVDVTATVVLKDTALANNYVFSKNAFTKEIEADWAMEDILLSGSLTKAYDGVAVDPTTLTLDTKGQEGTTSYKFYTDAQGRNEIPQAPKNAGRYYVKAVLNSETLNSSVESNLLGFTIEKAELTITVAGIVWQSGEEQPVPEPYVNHVIFDGLADGETLDIDVDYTASVTRVGTMEDGKVVVTVALKNTEKAANYKLKSATFEEDINSGNDSSQEDIWVSGLEDKVYTGSKITQTIQVFDGDQLLIENVDYTISYKNNTNAYEYTDEDLEKYEEAYKIDPKKTKGAGEFVAAKAPQVVLKMKGNYTGTKSLFFRIERADIEETSGDEYVFAIDNLVVVGNGKKQSPAPSVLWNVTGKTLKNNKDFAVKEYANKGGFTEVGSHELIVEGKGNFTGTRHITLQIVDSKNVVPMSKVTVKGVKALDYTGEEVSQKAEDLKVTYKKTDLYPETDFTISYENNQAAGTASIILTANGTTKDGMTFVGTKRITFKINGYNMAKVKATGLVAQEFTGYELDPLAQADQNGNPVVTLTIPKTGNLPEKTLTAENYFATYEKNVAKGTATVILTGRPESGVTGTKKLTFKITAAPLSDAELSGYSFNIAYDEGTNVYHTKGGAKPAVTVKNGPDIILVEGRDYTVTYKNNKQPGSGLAEIKGKGNYTGTVKKDFTIVAKPVSADNGNGVWVVVNDKVYSEKKNGWKQSFKVWDSDGKALAAADAKLKEAEYTVYELPEGYTGTLQVNDKLKDTDVVPVGGKVQIKVAMSGNYTGEVVGVYSIIEKSKDISKAKIQINPQQYTGKPVFIDSDADFKKVTLNGVTLTMEGEGKNIEIIEGSYINNVKMGTAKVTIRGVGEYGGIKTVTFKIGGRSVIDWLKAILYNG